MSHRRQFNYDQARPGLGPARRGDRRLPRWRRVACLVMLLVYLPSPSQEIPVSEYQVKAVWLLNFARFVEWPATAFPNARSPVVVGVLGKDPFGRELEQALDGKTVQGRCFQIKRVSTDPEMRGCHILFVASSERRRSRDLPEKLKGACVLTVGESDEFLDQGGIINFLLKDKTVRFEINLKAAQSAELKLDANLLKVAVAVRGKYD